MLKRVFAICTAAALLCAPVCLGEGRGDLIIDRDGDGAEDVGYQAVDAQAFAGSWQDETTQRATMEITADGATVSATVTWGASAEETFVWTFSGTVEPDGVVSYENGVQKTLVTLEDGTTREDVYCENSTGCLAIDNDGAIYWVDSETEASSTMRFVKVQ